MKLFTPATNTQAFLKMGVMGFAGDGKTYTSVLVAIGLIKLMRERGLPMGDLPAAFLDTETGSDWVKPMFDAASIELHTAKTRAFSDLKSAIHEAEGSHSILIIDSITHFWRQLTEEYAERKGRRRGLEFQDWAWLKTEWGRFTDTFVNSQCHIIMCGRAGYEYDFFENDAGKKELQKTGIKMKAETETGYEPSILVLMEKHRDMETGRVWRTASVLKDRSTLIDGKTFENPTFENFLPHIEYLNLGGKHMGVDTTRNSGDLFTDDGVSKWQQDKLRRKVALDDIIEILNKHHGGTSAEAKREKAALLEKHANTRTWSRIEELFSTEQVFDLRNRLHLELEGTPFDFSPPEPQRTDTAA